MNAENNIPKDESAESVNSIIKKINDGLLSIKDISEETRLECVDKLRLEGCTISQIAQALKLSDRTIKRYVKELKKHTILEADENFAKEFLGDLMQKISNSFNYLLRLSRNKETATADKIQAEIAACKLFLDLAKILQSTGHLPLQPQIIDADIYHHLGNVTEQDIIDIGTAAKDSIGLSEPLSKMLGDLRLQVKKSQDAGQDKEENNENKPTEQ